MRSSAVLCVLHGCTLSSDFSGNISHTTKCNHTPEIADTEGFRVKLASFWQYFISKNTARGPPPPHYAHSFPGGRTHCVKGKYLSSYTKTPVVTTFGQGCSVVRRMSWRVTVETGKNSCGYRFTCVADHYTMYCPFFHQQQTRYRWSVMHTEIKQAAKLVYRATLEIPKRLKMPDSLGHGVSGQGHGQTDSQACLSVGSTNESLLCSYWLDT